MTMKKRLAAGILAMLVTLLPIAATWAKTDAAQKGIASYYHDRFQGLKTASGEPYDRQAYTAAHRHLPLGTKVRVTHVATGKSILVRINDRGPFGKDRIIDLSRRAARDLGILGQGVAPVRVEVVRLPDGGRA